MISKSSEATHGIAIQYLEEALGNVWLMAELLNREDQELAPAKRAEYLSFISSTTAELSHLVADLALLNSYGARKAALNCTPLSLSELVLQCMEGLHGVAEARAVDVCLVSSGSESLVQGDYWKLSQAIGALIEDVIRNTAPGGCVDMEVLSIPKAVRLVIRSSEILATGKRSGMAGFLVGDGQKSDALLRVPLAREIIDLHGGLISGESAEQRFIVVLPSAV